MIKTIKNKPIYKSNTLLLKEQYTECVNWHTNFLTEKNVSTTKIKKVLQALVESYQNILSHANKTNSQFNTSITTYYKNKELTIVTSNYIDVLKKERLKNYLLLLRKRNKTQIKQTYNKRLLNYNKPNKNSSNMGLLVMSLITSKPPQFKFVPYSAKYYKFVLTLTITLNDEKFSSST